VAAGRLREPDLNVLFARALLAFLLLPGVVAFLLPLAVIAPDRAYDFRALALAIPGILLLLWCVREFYAAGRGTLAPWAPPRHLVVSGPYRFSRNPMYLAVLLILAAWAAGFRSRSLANYAAVVAILFYVRVVLFEEPWLDDTHGGEWLEYKARVPRWIGRPRRRRVDA
jgi:protein-S-isoprenylcysteine O-methyltransferase Ste14